MKRIETITREVQVLTVFTEPYLRYFLPKYTYILQKSKCTLYILTTMCHMVFVQKPCGTWFLHSGSYSARNLARNCYPIWVKWPQSTPILGPYTVFDKNHVAQGGHGGSGSNAPARPGRAPQHDKTHCLVFLTPFGGSCST